MRSTTSHNGASHAQPSDIIELDLPTLAAALSQRLHVAGLPVTPDRAVRFAQALSLVGPVGARQLYWTARAVFVSAHADLPTFDRVFASVFSCAHPGGSPDGVRGRDDAFALGASRSAGHVTP